jgi:hypothetical protein
VTVIEDESRRIPFMHKKEGEYVSIDPEFKAEFGRNYSLRIAIGENTYISDEVSIEKCAEIDSLNFIHDVYFRPGEQEESMLLRLQITTHQDEEASRYYRYIKEETWLTIAHASSNRKYKPIFTTIDGAAVDVDWEVTEYENIRYCWPSTTSRNISLATTEGLTANKLVNVNVSSINIYSDKLLYKFSALVKQLSLSKEAHHFLSMLKDFSEGDGLLFEVQPGFIEGNIYSMNDPDKNVIGIFHASAVKEKRIFILLKDLEPEYVNEVFRNRKTCEFEFLYFPTGDSIPDSTLTESFWLLKDSLLNTRRLAVSNIVFDGILDTLGNPIADILYFSNPGCVDCRGSGTNIKPEWWGDLQE